MQSNEKVWVIRMVRDESADTTLVYLVASASLALTALAGVRLLVPIIVSYLHRIYLVATLLIL